MREGSDVASSAAVAWRGHLLRATIHRAFVARGLWPAWSTYERARALTTDWGEREWGELARGMGAREWHQALSIGDHAVSERDVVRILGVGRLLAEYLLAPLRLPADAILPLVRLGALANLIVALFDHFIDEHAEHRPPLSRSELRAPIANGLARFIRARPTRRPAERIMRRLVRAYYQRLEALPVASAAVAHRRLRIVRLQHRAIRTMYDAECEAAADIDCRPSVARRKSALPFVVMGVPGWLASERDDACLRSHLGFLYRLGIHFSSIDDAVDLERDHRKRQHNAFLVQPEPSADDDARVAERVADRALRIVMGWRARSDPERLSHPEIAHALEITTCSWFGGIGWRSDPSPHPLAAVANAL